MSTKTSLSRRGFVAMNAAGAAMIALPSAGAAATPLIEAAAPVGPFNWLTSGAAELSAHIGRRFRFSDGEGGSAVMRLVDVRAVKSGAARPVDLPRAEGVTAIFDGPDSAPLLEAGHKTYRVGALGLGTASVMAGPVRDHDGSDVIEIVLN